MTAEDTAEPTLAITEQAIEKVRGFRAQSEDPESQALWVEVSGVSDGEYVYKISLNAVHVARQDDVVQRHGDLAIVVPESSVEKLRGATIDWSQGLEQSGLTVVNPNKPPAPAELPMMSPPMAPPASPPIDAPPAADLSGDVAQRVIQVIDQQINPAIAQHGGHAELVAVEEDTAYLRLGGGCQGCGMATVTLGQGIEVAITEAVPEIARVVDVTDHAVGDHVVGLCRVPGLVDERDRRTAEPVGPALGGADPAGVPRMAGRRDRVRRGHRRRARLGRRRACLAGALAGRGRRAADRGLRRVARVPASRAASRGRPHAVHRPSRCLRASERGAACLARRALSPRSRQGRNAR